MEQILPDSLTESIVCFVRVVFYYFLAYGLGSYVIEIFFPRRN